MVVVAFNNERLHSGVQAKKSEMCGKLHVMQFKWKCFWGMAMQLSTVHVKSSFEKLFASELISRGIRLCCEYESWCMPFYGIFFSPRFSICNLTASLANVSKQHFSPTESICRVPCIYVHWCEFIDFFSSFERVHRRRWAVALLHRKI